MKYMVKVLSCLQGQVVLVLAQNLFKSDEPHSEVSLELLKGIPVLLVFSIELVYSFALLRNDQLVLLADRFLGLLQDFVVLLQDTDLIVGLVVCAQSLALVVHG